MAKPCNLVLSTNSGEAETLYGKIDPKIFGDRAFRCRKTTYDEEGEQQQQQQLKISRKRDSSIYSEPLRHCKSRRLETVLTISDYHEGVYQPKTKKTQAAYEAMLGIIQQQLGGQPLNIVTVVADEILDVLKKDAFMNSKKKEEIERLLNQITDNVFDQFVSIGRLITDYGGGDDDGAFGDDSFDEDAGVAVEFEENEESDLDMVQDDDDDYDDDDDLTDGNGSGAMQMGGGIIDDDHDHGVEENDGMTLNIQDIDDYWLQRKISKAYEQKQQQIDPQQSQKLAKEVLKILAEGGGDRQVETKLLVHLRFDKFSLVKYLLKNRMYIMWGIRLARAQDQEERKKIEEEMMHLGPNLAVIVEQLHATRATAKERQTNLEKSIRQEAHRLKDNGNHGPRATLDRDADIVWSKGQRQLLDLESLAFSQGGLLMTNRKCELPSGSYRKHNKDYEEVHVPALRPKPLASGEELIRVSDMPDWARPAFEGMSQLNRVQSKVYDTALFSAQNLLLCAPTGAGKTNVAMLTMLQQIALNRSEDGSINHSNYKIVYVAPMKALVAEVVENLSLAD